MGDKIIGLKKVWPGVALAAALWFVMFAPWTAPHINFWWVMTGSALVLTSFSLLADSDIVKALRFDFKQIVAGLCIAFVLWWVFWIGDKVSQMLFSFARPQVDMIYSIRDGSNPTVIALLLLCIIGPAEEIFWRGFVQRRLMARFNPNVGFVLATACYTLVHIWSFNFMLVMAAMVVGGCWGLIYRFFPHSLVALIVSHAIWDACAFVLFPF